MCGPLNLSPTADYAQAAAWYRKAAERENGAASYNLGVMYGTGQGVPQDYAGAVMPAIRGA